MWGGGGGGGDTVENTLKGDGAQKREGETKTLKRGLAWSRGGCLKKRKGWNLLTKYGLLI